MEFSGFNNSNLLFNDSASLPRESLDQVFGRNNVYNNVFRQHPSGHHVHEPQSTREPEKSRDHAEDYFRTSLRNFGNETEVVSESLDQHKYSRLANSSYDYYDSKGDADVVHEGLGDAKYSHVQDLKDFKVDENLSTRDNLVLHNDISGETHVSYRGTTDKMSKQFFEDWKINGQITGGNSNTKRVREAQNQFEKVVEKYGKENLTVSGHSQGGHVSYAIATKNDVPGFHYNPAINGTQVREAERYSQNISEQMIFKQPLDFASPLAFHKNLAKSNTKLNIVSNLFGKDSVVETHSIDQFAPTPKEVVGDIVMAERRTLAGSIVQGAGHVAGVGLTAYSFAEDVKKDKNIAEVGVDLAKTGEEYVVDGEILTAGLAMAPETMGLSLVASLGMVVVNDLVAEHTSDYIKDELPKLGNTLKKTGNNIGRWFKKHF